MKKKHHSYSKISKGTSPSSHIIIIVLFIIFVILIYNYFTAIRDPSSASSGKKISDYFKSLSKNAIIDSSTAESNPTNGNSFQSKTNTSPSPIIIIDAGHGGPDPGKVSESGTLEKDLNLRIALILKNLLEAQDINVIMTRDTDKDLSTSDKGRKMSDMKERIKLIDASNANLVIGIHQNSYPNPDVYGAQCFYLSGSEEGREIASLIQEQIITSTNQTKIREIKDNGDYYLLKHSPLPTVIVECGFLSNPAEEQLLLTDEYQRKLAWGIHMGILQYFKNK